MYSYKKYNDEGNFGIFKRIWKWLKRKFPTRPFITYKNGVIFKRHITTQMQLLGLFFGIFFFSWSIYSTYTYFIYKPLMRKADEKVAKAEVQYSKILQEVLAYRDSVSQINDNMDRSNSAILEKLEKSAGLKKEDKQNMLKNHQQLTAELDYVNKKMGQFASELKFADIDIKGDYYKTKNMEIQRDIAWQEQANVKKRNAELESSMIDIREANMILYGKFESIANGSLEKIEKDYSKIKRTLDSLGLSDKKELLKKLEKEEFRGGPFIPLDDKQLKDYELNQKYQDIKDKVNLWEGLSKLSGVLPLGSPVSNASITSTYGIRSDPFNGQPSSHQGIDFAGQVGTPLTSVNAGIVKKTGVRGAYGKTVEIEHGLGFSTLFAHLEKIAVKEGDTIRAGQIIGYAGSSGRSTGPHLHYEIRYNGNAINPYNFVKTTFETKK